MSFFDPVKHWAAASTKWATKSIFGSALHIAMITTPLALILAYLAHPPMNYLFFAFAALPVIFCMVWYSIFSSFDRDRLQSEEHVIRKQVVAKIGDKEAGRFLLVDQTETSSNPAVKELP